MSAPSSSSEFSRKMSKRAFEMGIEPVGACDMLPASGLHAVSELSPLPNTPMPYSVLHPPTVRYEWGACDKHYGFYGGEDSPSVLDTPTLRYEKGAFVKLPDSSSSSPWSRSSSSIGSSFPQSVNEDDSTDDELFDYDVRDLTALKEEFERKNSVASSKFTEPAGRYFTFDELNDLIDLGSMELAIADAKVDRICRDNPFV